MFVAFIGPITLAASDSRTALLLAGVLVLGVGAQWAAWRLRVPSIILLLVFGLAVGPGWSAAVGRPLIDPDGLLGELLLPLVGISVGLILYEGGLTLRVRELRGQRRVVTMLVSVGALITWLVGALAAHVILDLEAELAVLLGAVLIVTGPTVIGPLLGHIRPAGSVGPVLKWEGIVIDPIGALAAVLALEVILIRAGAAEGAAARQVALAIGKTVLIGGGLGAGAAIGLVWLLRGYLVPEPLQNPLSLTLVVAVYTGSNWFQQESGLLAATAMGVVVANQSSVEVRHLLEFKENLRVLLLSALFIVLGARLSPGELAQIRWGALAGFIGILVVLARPLAVWVSTLGSELTARDRLFMCWMAPRGIVAAAVSSVFAIALGQPGADGEPIVPGAERLVAYTFAVIIATVALYGLTAPLLARRLGLSDENPQGILIVGGSRLARSIAIALRRAVREANPEHPPRIMIVDINRDNVIAAHMEGLDASHGDILEESFVEGLDLRGIGRAIAMTPNAEINTLALQRLAREFGGSGVFGLPVQGKKQPNVEHDKPGPADPKGATTHGHHGRTLFAPDIDIAELERRLAEDWFVKATPLTPGLPWDAYRALYGEASLMLFVVSKTGEIDIITTGRTRTPTIGETVVSMVDPGRLLMGPMIGPDQDAGRPETGEAGHHADGDGSPVESQAPEDLAGGD